MRTKSPYFAVEPCDGLGNCAFQNLPCLEEGAHRAQGWTGNGTNKEKITLLNNHNKGNEDRAVAYCLKKMLVLFRMVATDEHTMLSCEDRHQDKNH